MSLNEAVDSFQNQMIANGFGVNYLNARVANMIGQPTIRVTYANVDTAKSATNGILENCPGFMGFLVHNERDGTFTIEKPIMHSRKLYDAGLKFRKIKGNTPQEAMHKLAAWFLKNKAIIYSVGTRHT